MENFRNICAWVFGLAAFISMGVALTAAGDLIGITSSVYLGESIIVTHGSGRASYEDEIDSYLTFYGQMTGGLALMIGLWAGQAIYQKSLDAGFTQKGKYTFFAWLIAFFILSVVAAITSIAFQKFHGLFADYARMTIELGFVIGIAWSLHQWWKNRTEHLDDFDVN